MELYYLLAADLILILHVAFVAFVVLSLLFIYVGHYFGWHWIRNPWFRLVHLAAIGVVVLESWVGMICPLTSWEMALRKRAGDAVYDGAFIAHWLEGLLYYRAPGWVFVLIYTVFGGLVVISWFWIRPRPFKSLPDKG